MTSTVSIIVTSVSLTHCALEEYKDLRVICIELDNSPV
jgi:hypothetical protein